MKRHVMTVAVTADAPIFEVTIPWEVFGRPNLGAPDPWYDLRFCAPPGLRTGGGFVPDTQYGYDSMCLADTVVVAPLAVGREMPQDLVSAVKAAHGNGARVVSLCTGAFVLAEAGLLNGRSAATHWRHAETLRRLYPLVKVDPKVLYVDDGDVLTSAGATAAIDLCLHIVRLDHGAAVANRIARRLVAPPHRDGGQAQYIDLPMPQHEEGLSLLLDRMRRHLHEPITVTTLARWENVTERTLLRRFRQVTGTTPIKWLTAQRLQQARHLLETTTLPMDRVAEASGLGSPANFRRHFMAEVGVSPHTYRRTFTGKAGDVEDDAADIVLG